MLYMHPPELDKDKNKDYHVSPAKPPVIGDIARFSSSFKGIKEFNCDTQPYYIKFKKYS